MRIILMFDLPVETAKNRKDYRRFVRLLKKQGYIMMQKSIYVKLLVNDSAVTAQKKIISDNIPKEGFISILSITEKQFQSIDNLIGERSLKVIDTDERYIEI